ncbi:MAG: hypothetical protein HC914_18990 [Chloroflexaceae bacterium]|nr:hypothetical protein [Chloroflexaceae bacterium]
MRRLPVPTSLAAPSVKSPPPHATLTNVGRTSQEDQFYLEGTTNLREQAMQMRLWLGGGSTATPAHAVEVRIEQGKTLIRQGTDTWQEVESLTDSFAPQGDFLSYLVAVRDITTHEPETRHGRTFIRHTFTIDGPAFAVFMRDQITQALHARGELPPGMQFAPPEALTGLSGTGELWVDSNGLPLRQVLHLAFPEQDDTQSTAEITVDFARFGAPQGFAWVVKHLPIRRSGWPSYWCWG